MLSTRGHNGRQYECKDLKELHAELIRMASECKPSSKSERARYHSSGEVCGILKVAAIVSRLRLTSYKDDPNV